ncbi:MAG TPA: FAD-binding oxidoreductase [Gemmatimonadaceae bacterium]|nr:FAD-binding oxidoreductase [Gemmatimonadaceae bacterium]
MRPTGFRGIFRTDELARAVYSEGAGIARILPLAVAVPADAEDVRALVAWAHATATPLVPRGSGSGMAGGATGSGVIVDLSRLAATGAVDTERRLVETGAGTLRAAVDAQARAVGLRFPVDPSSGQFCTVGGMASTNAAGAHTLRYGAMREWIAALDCVFEDGSRAMVRRGEEPPLEIPAVRRFMEDVSPTITDSAPAVGPTGLRKQSSGYAMVEYARSRELVDLLVGSEGTLALFVGLELSLAPAPAATISLLAAFDDLDAAVRAAGDARRQGASACELLDRTFLEVAAMGDRPLPVPAGTEAVLLTEVEGESTAEAADAGTSLKRAFLDAGAVEVTLAYTPEVEDALWALRHAASPILSRLDQRLKSMQFIEDGAVPPERLADYVLGVRAALEAHDVRGVIFGHAGDGHIHVNPLVDVGRPDWRERVARLLDDVVDLTARLGGTLTGEHGDGRLRAPVLDRIWSPEALAMFARVKGAFDPAGILNPGVKIPLDGQQPIDAVKYDPSLPPLPDRARRALDHVERERAYHRFRLALLDEMG